jgi:hypothetical protein
MKNKKFIDEKGHLIGREVAGNIVDEKGHMVSRYIESSNRTVDGKGHNVGVGDQRDVQLGRQRKS